MTKFPHFFCHYPFPKPFVRAVLLGLVFLWSLWPAVTFAHAYPVRSSPAANSSVHQSPQLVEIWFSESLEPRLSELVVYDEAKRDVTVGPPQVDQADSSQLSVNLPQKLPSGTYTVVWHVVSAEDGHSTAGVFAFGIGVPADVPVIAPRQLDAVNGQSATPIGIIGRWLSYLGVSVFVGTAFFACFIDRTEKLASDQDSVDPAERWLRALVRSALLIFLLGQVLLLADEISIASSQGAVGLTGQNQTDVVLLGSRFGALWLARIALTVLAVILDVQSWRVQRTPRWFWLGILAVGLGLLADEAWSGHAAAGNLLAYVALIQTTIGLGAVSPLYLRAAALVVHLAKPFTLVVDWLHLASVAVWFGGLLALAGAARITHRSKDSLCSRSYRATVANFARFAKWALVIVVCTGIYNTWLYLAGPSSYLSTGYGRSLLLKHVFIVAVLLVAAINHFVTVPVITAGRPRGHWPPTVRAFFLRHSVGLLWFEAGLGVLVLLSTGLVTSLGPARTPWQILADPSRELALEAIPFVQSLQTDRGQTVRLSLNPGRTGRNRFMVTVNGAASTAGIDRAYLELTPETRSFDALGPPEILTFTKGKDGEFSVDALIPSVYSFWQAHLLLYQANGRIGTAATDFQIANGGTAPVDPTVKALLDRASDTMEGLQTVQMTESLSDGAGGLVLSAYRFAAPGVEEIQTASGESVIHRGRIVYQSSAVSDRWVTTTDAPTYVWPKGAFGYLKAGVGGIQVGQATLDGQQCSIVAFYAPASDAIYEEWIATDGRIYEEIMAAPSHFMINRYFAFNGPDTIHIPPGRSGR